MGVVGRLLICLAWVVLPGCSAEPASNDTTGILPSTSATEQTEALTGSSTTESRTTSISATATPTSSSTGEDGSSSDSGTTVIFASSSTGNGSNVSAPGSTSTGEMCPDAPEDGTYSTCLSGFFCSGGGSCLEDEAETFQVCTRGCIDVCNCWPTPEGEHTATVACRDDVLVNMSNTCVLDCTGGATCPEGMICLDGLSVCVFDPPVGTTSTSTGAGSSDTGI